MVMFLIIVFLICFTEVRHSVILPDDMFIAWDDAQVFIYDQQDFHKMTEKNKQVISNATGFLKSVNLQ